MTFTTADILKSYKRSWWKIALSGLLLAAAAYGLCALLPNYFGFSALIHVARLPALPSDSGVMGASSLPTKDPFALRKESAEYLNFKYLNAPSDANQIAFLKKLEESKTSDLITLTVYGLTSKDAHNLTDSIITDLRKRYEPLIKDTEKTIKEQIQVYESQIKALDSALATNADALKALGYTTTLIQQKNDMEIARMRTQTNLNDLKAAISDQKLFNFYFDHAYDLDVEPVSPPTALIIFIAFILGLACPMIIIFFKEEDRFLKMNASSSFSQISGQNPNSKSGITSPLPLKSASKLPLSQNPRTNAFRSQGWPNRKSS